LARKVTPVYAEKEKEGRKKKKKKGQIARGRSEGSYEKPGFGLRPGRDWKSIKGNSSSGRGSPEEEGEEKQYSATVKVSRASPIHSKKRERWGKGGGGVCKNGRKSSARPLRRKIKGRRGRAPGRPGRGTQEEGSRYKRGPRNSGGLSGRYKNSRRTYWKNG